MKIEKREVFFISNLFSMLRLVMAIPVFFLLGNLGDSFGYRLFVLAVLLLTGSTDALDGYFARKRNEITEFGKIIDPLADKVIVGVMVLQLFLMGEMPAYYFYGALLRDVLIFIGGIFVTRKLGKVLPSNMLGKITVIAISFFILSTVLNGRTYFPFVNSALEYMSFILIIVSFIAYVIRAKESLTWNKHESVQEH